MRFCRQLPVFAAVSGLAGALLRAMQLSTGFELGTGLYLSDNLWGQLLLGWLLFSVALCAVLARRGQHYACFEDLFGSSDDFYKTMLALSGLLLAAGGLAWLPIELRAMQGFADDSNWILALEVPFGLLCVVAGLCFVGLGAVLSRGEMTERHALMTMPPLFWAAFHLLVVYRQYCVSANLSLFTVEIFASIACVMAFYHFSKMLYGRPTPRQFTFWAAVALSLALTDVFGYVLSLALGNIAVRWTLGAIVRGGCLLMGNVFLFAELWTISGKRLFPWRTKYSPELEEEEPPVEKGNPETAEGSGPRLFSGLSKFIPKREAENTPEEKTEPESSPAAETDDSSGPQPEPESEPTPEEPALPEDCEGPEEQN